MRVCDRHPDRIARDMLVLDADDARFDLCDECKSDVLMFLTSEVEKPAPPAAKRSATAEKRAPQTGL